MFDMLDRVSKHEAGDSVCQTEYLSLRPGNVIYFVCQTGYLCLMLGNIIRIPYARQLIKV